MALTYSNQYGQAYKFGFLAADAPTIDPNFIPRSAELRYEPEVFNQGYDRSGTTIALAVTAPAKRKITAAFTGYVFTTFDPTAMPVTFTWNGRTYVVRNVGNMRRKAEFNECVIDAESLFGISGSGVGVGDNIFIGTDGFVESIGELNSDIYGLQTCETTFKYSQADFIDVTPAFEQNPFFPWLNCEATRVTEIPGFFIVTKRYAGVSGGTSTPIYELTLGLGEDPIQTHKKFVSDIAGTPSAPLNGAYFIDPETGLLSTDDATGEFDHFRGLINGQLNLFAGISTYLNLSNVCWRERYVTTQRPTDMTTIGYIDSPHGPAPNLPPDANWLNMGTSYEQRGLCYFVTNEWRGSGPRGWNPIIYSA